MPLVPVCIVSGLGAFVSLGVISALGVVGTSSAPGFLLVLLVSFQPLHI